MILNQSLFHLRILCYLYLKAFSIHDFKSDFVPSQDTTLYIFKFVFNSRFKISIVLHLKILWYLYFLGFSLHNFKSVVVPPQDTMLFIFKGVVNSWLEISVVCSILGNYSISIFQALSIHDFKSVLCSISGYYVIYFF